MRVPQYFPVSASILLRWQNDADDWIPVARHDAEMHSIAPSYDPTYRWKQSNTRGTHRLKIGFNDGFKYSLYFPCAYSKLVALRLCTHCEPFSTINLAKNTFFSDHKPDFTEAIGTYLNHYIPHHFGGIDYFCNDFNNNRYTTTVLFPQDVLRWMKGDEISVVLYEDLITDFVLADKESREHPVQFWTQLLYNQTRLR